MFIDFTSVFAFGCIICQKMVSFCPCCQYSIMSKCIAKLGPFKFTILVFRNVNSSCSVNFSCSLKCCADKSICSLISNAFHHPTCHHIWQFALMRRSVTFGLFIFEIWRYKIGSLTPYVGHQEFIEKDIHSIIIE